MKNLYNIFLIQIHSTWFPYIDRNPQKYVDNIYKANAADFVKATIKVYGTSVVEVGGEQELRAKLSIKHKVKSKKQKVESRK